MALLQEEKLRALSRGFSSWMPQDGAISTDDLERFQSRLDDFFVTAEQPQLSPHHRAAACNTLCGFLEQGSGSSSPELKELCLSHSVWRRLLLLYLERFQDPMSRPMKQVLSTLIKLLVRDSKLKKNQASHDPPILLTDAVSRCLSLISSDDDLLCVKPAMLFLDTTITKRVVNPRLLVSLLSLGDITLQRAASSTLYYSIQSFVGNILRWARHIDIAPAAGKLLGSFFSVFHASNEDDSYESTETEPAWLQPITLEMSKSSPVMLETLEKQILPGLIYASPRQILQTLENLPLDKLASGKVGLVSENDIRFCMLILKVLGDIKLYRELNEAIEALIGCSLQALRTRLGFSCLCHKSPAIMNAAAILLTHSRVVSEPIEDPLLQMLKSVFAPFFAETDPKSRGESLTIVKRLCIRLTVIIGRLKKAASESKPGDAPVQRNDEVLKANRQLLERYTTFGTWLQSFLQRELQPSASYQRHIAGLKALSFEAVRDFLACCQINILDGCILQQLLGLIMDGFNDVRSTSASLLRVFDASTLQEALILILPRAELLMQSTGRADYSDGFGRLCELSHDCSVRSRRAMHSYTEDLCQGLIRDVNVAERDLNKAIANAPMHGRMIALRYIVSRDEFYRSVHWDFHKLLLECCERIWSTVQPVLCVDSPEGQFDEEEDKSPDVGIKDTLSFCWRALKESSSLMQALLSHPRNDHLLASEKRVGGLSLKQLAGLRHRGAFSTVAQTFTTCCLNCATSKCRDAAGLPKQWYSLTLDSIQVKANALTRRSAGLPAMVTSILVAYPFGPFFDSSILNLQETACVPALKVQEFQEVHLPQIHALNCLKDIFTNTRLGPSTEKHLNRTFKIAADCLNREIWAIKNCGVMLLKALLTRVSGGTSVKDWHALEGHHRFAKATYNKYPELAILIEKLLQDGSSTNVSESLWKHASHEVHTSFPAMEAINRIGLQPSRGEEVESLLLMHLDSPVWTIRDKAARTLGSLTSDAILIESIKEQIGAMPLANNGVHGRLLCLKSFYENNDIVNLADSNLENLLTIPRRMLEPSCPPIAIAYLESLVNILYKLLSRNTAICSRGLVGSLKRFLHSIEGLPVARNPMVMQSVARFGALLSLILSKDQSTLRNAVHTVPALIPQAYLAHARLEALSRCPDLARIEDVVEAIDFVQNHSNPAEQSEIDVGRCASLLGSFLKRYQYERHEHAMPQKLVDDSFLILTAKRYLGTSSPALAQADLELVGAILALLYLCVVDEQKDKVLARLFEWSQSVRLSLDDLSDFPTRHSAILSLNYFETGLRKLVSKRIRTRLENRTLLNISSAISDSLTDDDDEIRGLAAAIASSSYISTSLTEQADSIPLTPIVAQQKLLQFLSSNLNNSDLLLEALARTLGLSCTDRVILAGISDATARSIALRAHIKPAAQNIKAAMKQDTSLFVEEKQNLYRDEALEAQQWTDVLCTMPPATVIDTDTALLPDLRAWTLAGLATLEKHLDKQDGGALSWTYMPDVFVMGARVFCAARVVLAWEGRMSAVQVSRNGGTVGTMEAALKRVRELGIARAAHPVWVRMVGDVLVSQGG